MIWFGHVGSAARRALSALARRPGTTAMAIGAVATTLALAALVHLAALNVSSWTSSWGGGVQMVVYLEHHADEQRADELADVLRGLPAVTRIDYVDSADAYHRLRQSLGAHEALLDGVELAMLPASLEVSLQPGVSEVAALHPVVADLEAADGVESIEFLDDWSERLGALYSALELAALALGLLAAGAAVYTIGSTVRLQVRDRGEEQAVYELVGAGPWFGRGALMFEGAFQGAAGALAAAGLLWVLYSLGADALQQAVRAAFGPLSVQFLPAGDVARLVALGAALGAVAGWLATWRAASRHRYPESR